MAGGACAGSTQCAVDDHALPSLETIPSGKCVSSSDESSGGETGVHLPPPLYPEALAHATRLARASVDLIEERAVALEKHQLAPAAAEPARPLRSLLRNVWVLAIMAGIVGIIVAAKSRIHVPEPLQGVHATSGTVPYVTSLADTSVDYLFVNLLIGPYFPPSSEHSPGGGGHRRRLAAWVGEAVSQYNGAGALGTLPDGVAPHPLVTADAGAELTAGVKKLLHKPKITLAKRRGFQSRRLLVDDGVEEPTADTASELPQLKVTLMQRANASAAAPPADGTAAAVVDGSAAPEPGVTFVPVSESQYCTTKEEAAVKCSMAFQGGDMTDAWVQGEPLYLGFEATQLTQLVFRSEVSELGGLGPVKNWLALAILMLVLVGIASERIHRMWCAMIGAALMMSLLLWMNMTPSLALVIEWLDESTLGPAVRHDDHRGPPQGDGHLRVVQRRYGTPEPRQDVAAQHHAHDWHCLHFRLAGQRHYNAAHRSGDHLRHEAVQRRPCAAAAGPGPDE